MPDWVTHIFIGLIICELLNIRKKSLVIFGALLPDIAAKAFLVSAFIPVSAKEIKWTLVPLHNPVALIFLTIIISIVVFRFPFKNTFFMISLGWLSHIIIDLTNSEIIPNQAVLLFPFSWKAFESGPFWGSGHYYLLMISGAVYLSVRIAKHYYYKNKTIKNTT